MAWYFKLNLKTHKKGAESPFFVVQICLLGHVFGLSHDDKDPLMMTHYGDGSFTGQITAETAAKVAQNLRGGILCECGACSALRA